MCPAYATLIRRKGPLQRDLSSEEQCLAARNFFQGRAKSVVVQISIVIILFLLISGTNFFWEAGKSPGGPNCFRGMPPVEESQIFMHHNGFTAVRLTSEGATSAT